VGGEHFTRCHVGTRGEHHEGSDTRISADADLGRFDRANHGVLPDLDVAQHRVGSDLRATRHDAASAQDRAGQERYLGREFDVGVDVGVRGTPHRHPPGQPLVVDSLTHHGLGAGQLAPVVDVGAFRGVIEQHREGHVAEVVEY